MEDEKKKKTGRDIDFIQPEQASSAPLPSNEEPLSKENFDNYIVILKKLQAPIRHITTAPTDTPQNFPDSIRLYDDGVNRRIYVFVNATWRYVALT